MARLTGLQMNIDWEDKSANHQRVEGMLAAQRPEPGTLVVLPEMFATGFSMRAAQIDDTESRETQVFLADLARKYQIWLHAGLVRQRADGRPTNQSLVYDPQGVEITSYEKIFPFAPGGELENYAAGDRIVLYQWAGFTVASFICYDLRFPEIFRMAAARGANLFIVIASWPDRRRLHWVRLLQARAIENQAYVLGVNRSGTDPFLSYAGDSMLVDWHGEVVSGAGAGDCLVTGLLDEEGLAQYRTALPFLKDMRPVNG